MNENETAAYRRGVKDRDAGKKLDQCPYEYSLISKYWWTKGWADQNKVITQRNAEISAAMGTGI